eukprot:CAMPEP_0119120996 /NCGR_PEP_ID=MMETSP1310-20130426/1813_1 /TAXON_ID=464262 /ORGANISM="Genus nov. species nov., Strain RCC2339" /LENGTH=110 /DNA_ID=CAMNT_0007110527 /DNA_START=113 /DNA_END=441 /DNA_ORIENTATION=-
MPPPFLRRLPAASSVVLSHPADLEGHHWLHVQLLGRLRRVHVFAVVQKPQHRVVELLPLAVCLLEEAQRHFPLHLEIHVGPQLVPDPQLDVHSVAAPALLLEDGVAHALP